MSDDPLDLLNRFVISIVALLVAFVALVLVLLAWGATDGSIGRVEDLARWLRDHDGNQAKLVLTLGAAVVVLLMLTVMIVELTPSPSQRMRLRNVKAGAATITTKDIATRVEQAASELPHVLRCEAIIAAHGDKVEAVLDLHVDAGADLSQTADAACRAAQVTIEQEIGVILAQAPRARMHYRELRLQDGERRPSTGWERPAGDERT